jgi:hypothetical protein
VYATLNRIPFFINNDNELKIKKEMTHFVIPKRLNVEEWMFEEPKKKKHKLKIDTKFITEKRIQDDQNDFVKINDYDDISFSDEVKSISNNKINIETDNSQSPSSYSVSVGEIDLHPREVLSIAHRDIRWEFEINTFSKSCLNDKPYAASFLLFSKIMDGILNKQRIEGFRYIKSHWKSIKMMNRMVNIFAKYEQKIWFTKLNNLPKKLSKLWSVLNRVTRETVLLNISESFCRLKLQKLYVEWNEKAML